MLRSAIPNGIYIYKSTRLVMALAKLHNYCIDESDRVASQLPEDELNIRASELGSVPMETVPGTNQQVPRQLLGDGHHFLDYPRELRRASANDCLPRDRMLQRVIDKGLTRPTPRQLRN